ncbi:hypothetical protein ACFL0D_00295 [Thermoproteota archaeon]
MGNIVFFRLFGVEYLVFLQYITGLLFRNLSIIPDKLSPGSCDCWLEACGWLGARAQPIKNLA